MTDFSFSEGQALNVHSGKQDIVQIFSC